MCHFSFTCFRMLWFQPTSPIRSEVDVKLGGTRCNLVMGRLKPWMQLLTSKKKKMVLREETPIPERPESTKLKDIMWTCTLSAPEMTIVLYNLAGLAVYHVSCLPIHNMFLMLLWTPFIRNLVFYFAYSFDVSFFSKKYKTLPQLNVFICMDTTCYLLYLVVEICCL